MLDWSVPPTRVSTCDPSLYKKSVGIVLIALEVAKFGWESTSWFAITILSAILSEIVSKIGFMALQGTFGEE